jgi:sulfate permease, SulP family
MKGYKRPREKTIVNIKDIIMIILIIVPFLFIDLRTALFVGAICTSLLLMHGTIRHLKSRYLNSYRIPNEENELSFPKGVEVFELAGNVPMEILYKYISVLRPMKIRPKILITRFKQISQIHSHEAHVLEDIIRELSKCKIRIFISGVEGNLKNQFKKYNLNQKNSSGGIFYKIDDALKQAETILNIQ